VKTWFLRWKKRHIWLLTLLMLLAAFLIGRNSRPLMNFLVEHVTSPVKNAIGAVCYLVPFPVYEAAYLALAAWAVWYLAAMAVKVRRSEKGQRWQTAYGRLLLLVCVVLTIADWFCLAWGINYYADGFQEKSGIYARKVSVEELCELTERFTAELNAVAEEITRDENGVFAVSREEIFAGSTAVYDEIGKEFPFLAREDRPPKAMMVSKLLSAMGFTGVYAGFTGESLVNVDSPAAYLPCTITHELAHQRGIASEQECNFIAVLASTRCGDPVYAYSGYLVGYTHLSNALYRADPERWQQVRAKLSDKALTDIRYNSAYWQQWESPVDTVSQKVYDTVLKSNGQSDGVKSYGTMVDLLAAYYLDE